MAAKSSRKSGRTKKASAGKTQTPKSDASVEMPRGNRFVRYVVTLTLLGALVIGWLSLVSYCPTDKAPHMKACYLPTMENHAGVVGSYTADFLRYYIGRGSYILLAVGSLWVALMLLGRTIRDLSWRLTGLALTVTAWSTVAFLQDPDYKMDIVQGNAGVIGEALGGFLRGKFQETSWLVVVLVFLAGLLLMADEWLKQGWVGMKLLLAKRAAMKEKLASLRLERPSSGAKPAVPQTVAAVAKETAEPPVVKPPRHRPPGMVEPEATSVATSPADESVPAQSLRPTSPVDDTLSQAPKVDKEQRKSFWSLFGFGKKTVEAPEAQEQEAASTQVAGEMEDHSSVTPVEAELSDSTMDDSDAMQISPAMMPKSKPAVKKTSKPKAAGKSTFTPKTKKTKAIKRANTLPSLNLLVEPKGGYNEQAEIQAVQRKQVLQQTLVDFSVDAQVVGYETGPVITLFEVSLAPGVKTAAVTNLSTDIARSLAVPGVRVVPPRFGKDTVGIEVPNLDKETVRLRDLMTIEAAAEKKMRLPMYLGKDAGGDAIVMDLAKAPHLLIAGTTGSGKSVCINTIIMSLLMTRTVEDVRFILVDPKMVEMAAFEKLPHLLCPTITDMKKAEAIMDWACIKMDERYEILREAGVKNLQGYNKLSKKQLYERFNAETEEEQARIPHPMPSYVIIIDELADLMMTSGKEVETYIIRIAQKARAVGIHLVLATQRPSANVVTGLIKSNMPCKISFRVASGQESRIILDSKGAEVLLGQGDMLVLQPGTSTPERAQGTFIDDDEIYSVVKELESSGEPQYDNSLMQLDQPGGGEALMEKDELFDQAVEIVLGAKRGSVSLLQRRMAIGYGRASRIIDQMAEAGLIGTHKGSQARECLMTLEDWHEYKASIDADQSGSNSYNGAGTSF